MDKPETSLEWATEQIDEIYTNTSGEDVLTTNKIEPSSGTKTSGVIARGKFVRSYINYMLHSTGQWCKYNNEGQVGDFKFLPTSEDSSSVELRFGGTWADHGTDTFAGQTIRVFQKTA